MLDSDQLIVEAATGARSLTSDELQWVLEHVAQAGFDPTAQEIVRGELAGILWRGRVLKGRDRLLPAERHYVKHVLRRREWPTGTALVEYLESSRAVILDPRSSIFTSRYQGELQLGVVGLSARWRGPRGGRWILVEYRPRTGRWTTAYQLKRLRELKSPGRTGLRWLRGPR